MEASEGTGATRHGRWLQALQDGPDPEWIVLTLVVAVAVLLLAGIVAGATSPGHSFFGRSSLLPRGSFRPRAARAFLRVQTLNRDLQWVSGANTASVTMLAVATLILAVTTPVRDHTRDRPARMIAAVASLALLDALGALAAIVIYVVLRTPINLPGAALTRSLAGPATTLIVAIGVLWWVISLAGHHGPEQSALPSQEP